MSYSNSPRIITDGLILSLDASNSKSYSGSVWNNLVPNSIVSGTLLNGTGYSNTNYGNLIFDGVNDYIDYGNNELLQFNAGSISIVIKTTNPGTGFRGIVVKQNNYGLFLNNGNIAIYNWGNLSASSTTYNISDGLWHNICLTFSNNTGLPSNNATIYLDGENIFTTTIKYFNNLVPLLIGRGGLTSPFNSQFINASIACLQIYNNVLNIDQVKQNFNTIRSKFQS